MNNIIKIKLQPLSFLAPTCVMGLVPAMQGDMWEAMRSFDGDGLTSQLRGNWAMGRELLAALVIVIGSSPEMGP